MRREAARNLLVQTGVVTRLAGLAYVVQAYLGNFTLSVGPSMQPTLHSNGDVLLVDSVSPRLIGLRDDDIVIATKPTDPRVNILKRVRRPPPEHPARPNHVWLEGDNPPMSTDSRHYGHVPAALIRSRVHFRVWPPSRVGRLAPRPPSASPPADASSGM